MRLKLPSRTICLVFICLCSAVVVPTGFQLLTLPRIPGLELTASAAQILREARPPAKQVHLFEEQMRRRLKTSGHLVGGGEVKPKAKLLNKPSDLGSLSQHAYHVEGLGRDGQVVKIRLPENLWSQFGDKDYFKLLPGEPDDYKQMDVFTGRSKRLAFERVGGDWLSSSPFKAGIFTAPPKAELHTLRVTRIGDVEIVSMYPAGNEGGASIWVLTQEDRTAIAEIADHILWTPGVAHEGDDLPEDLKALLAESDVPYIRKSDRSANASGYDLQKAAELGNQPLSVANTKIFNALPYEEDLLPSLRELRRMDLSLWQSKEWRELDSQLRSSAERNQLPMVIGSKTEVLQELHSGNSNIVFVVAHSSGDVTYFPGRTGETISLQEVSGLKRKSTPERVVVLVTCEGGTVNWENASLAEVLLQNRLARTVFASHKKVDARLVPELLQEISMKGVAIREALKKYGFQQIAGLVRLPTDVLAA